MSIYGNVGFLGIPVAKALLSENAMLYVIICNVFYCLLFYTHGIITLSSGKEKMDLKKILSPGVIMSILALLIFWFDLKLPEVVVKTALAAVHRVQDILHAGLPVAFPAEELLRGVQQRLSGPITLAHLVLRPLPGSRASAIPPRPRSGRAGWSPAPAGDKH